MEFKSQIENANKEGMGRSACREEDGLKSQIENAEDEQMAREGWRMKKNENLRLKTGDEGLRGWAWMRDGGLR